MISRNTIRIKVMQAIYEYRLSSDKQVDIAENKLIHTFDNIYKLYLLLLATFGSMTHIAEQVIDLKRQKLIPLEADLQPNYKFINNLFIEKIEQNLFLQKTWRNNYTSWNNDLDMLFIRKMYDLMCLTPEFANYMQNHEQSFEQDKEFVIEIVEKFLLENEEINNYFGEKNLHWQHDYNDAVILVYNTLRSITKNQSDQKILPSLFKTDDEGVSEDQQFTCGLFRKTIQHDEEYSQIIDKKLLNWEVSRVAVIDFILLKMAICEFCEFPTIPLRVTLNEYIEISKYYSTNKSRYFINGMLDSILTDLKAEGKINKQGRGLMG